MPVLPDTMSGSGRGRNFVSVFCACHMITMTILTACFRLSRIYVFRPLETLLTEKSLVDPAALQLIIDTYQNKIGPQIGAALVAHLR